MPAWIYASNRLLTLVENILIGAKLSEYHTGYHAFSRQLLEQLPLDLNSNDFVFDHQMLTQIIWHDYRIAEITCPTKYFPEASSVNFSGSIRYGVGCLLTATEFFLAKHRIVTSERFRYPETARNR